MSDLKEMRVAEGVLGGLIGIGTRRIKQLVAKGVIPPATKAGYLLGPAVAGYVKFLRNGGGTPKHEELLNLRVRSATAKAEREERENEVARGEYVLATDMDRAAFSFGRRMRDAMQNIPPRIEALLQAENETASGVRVALPKVRQILDTEIRNALTDFANEVDDRDPAIVH